ncbi:uncharacterized protein LOC135815491 [Sycon ciliatum]|uniref:uncharacterized protein LOC135815491 n=1 Tax=Sycon ciliatum TaxID=27933 RepID=UPI0031F6CFD3
MDLKQFVQFGRKIVAVGRNYGAHAAELNNPLPKEPLLFLKPTSSYIEEGQAIKVPRQCQELHHEVELGVVIGKRCSGVDESSALSYVGGYTLALDMTARDLQSAAKKAGLPWTVAKGYDTFCPVSRFISCSELPRPDSATLWLSVDGQRRQHGNTNDMIFPIATLLSYISNIMTLEPGDVVLTGTPEGVSAVQPGSRIEAGLDGVLQVSFPVEKSA